MSRTASDITWTIGRTPLVSLRHTSAELDVRLAAKLEFLSPSGSNKDRAVLAMLEHAERAGYLQPGGTVVECSGGDLGIALALVGRARGYRVVLTLPECMAASRCNLVRALGAELVLTDSRAGIRGAIEKAEALAAEIDGAICLQPFSNRDNVRAHELGTAAEIWHDANGDVDVVLCPIGTGGTAAGCAGFFRLHAPDVQVYGVEPASSAVVSGQPAGPHNIPGIGAGFVPEILNPAHLAGALPVSDDDAVQGVRELARRETILAGPASGAVFAAARQLCGKPEMRGKSVVLILPDSGERYVEHPAYQGCPAIAGAAVGSSEENG